ncbi:MAG: type II toxin-antitoxin system VapC family toxin [Streptosporangiaceae bacterium]
MRPFLDSSALAKRYMEEPGAGAVSERLRFAGAAISRLAEIEVASAIGRRAHAGDLSGTVREQLLAELDDDLRALRVVEVGLDVVARARGLLRLHVLRAGDALQLASVLALQETLGTPLEFICFDQRLAAAARAEGLATV